jgi:hypothetical protein
LGIDVPDNDGIEELCFEFRGYGYFFAAEDTFSAYVFAIAGAAFFWFKHIAK